jgi:hypothetical protein
VLGELSPLISARAPDLLPAALLETLSSVPDLLEIPPSH